MGGRKPLTLEELRQMDGRPVQYEANGEIFIVDLDNPDFGECLVNEDGYYIPLHRAVDRAFGRRFFAYETPRIDRSAWKCGICEVPTHWVEWGKLGYEYCPHCVRPLTDASWDMLERRLAGRENK